jgi:hypothetical protein
VGDAGDVRGAGGVPRRTALAPALVGSAASRAQRRLTQCSIWS